MIIFIAHDFLVKKLFVSISTSNIERDSKNSKETQNHVYLHDCTVKDMTVTVTAWLCYFEP